ncbi:hypothetical protein LXA43DRAFT_578400 [Ganoderma leucocontextum]|nr:hypothetical protein LXA43DRAFT_578400 [Ganoderma leucocontextum]
MSAKVTARRCIRAHGATERLAVGANTPSPTNDSRPRRPLTPPYRPCKAHRAQDVDIGKRPQRNNLELIASLVPDAKRGRAGAKNTEILKFQGEIGRRHSGGGGGADAEWPPPAPTAHEHAPMSSDGIAAVLPAWGSGCQCMTRARYGGHLCSRTRVRRACQPTLPASRPARSCGILVDSAMARRKRLRKRSAGSPPDCQQP